MGQIFARYLLLLVFLLPPCLTSAQKTLLDKKVKISQKSGTVETLLNELSSRGGFTFTYSSRIHLSKKVTLTGNKLTVRDYLDQMFADENVKYYAKNDKVLLIPSTFQGNQKNYRIRGKIIDAQSREPVQFANIFLMDRSVGTISNAEGNFALNLKKIHSTDTICITFIGYQAEKIPIALADSFGIDIALKPEEHEIKEVWVKPVKPLEIIEKALENISHNYDVTPSLLTAFFRESTRQDNRYIALSEAMVKVYKESYLSPRADQVKIEKGRKGSNVKSQEYINYIVQGGLYNNFKLDVIKNGVSFLDKENFEFYDYHLDAISKYRGTPVYIIRFDQRDGVQFPMYKGSLFIDKESYAIVKAEFEISPKGIGYAHNMYVVKSPLDLKVKTLFAKYYVNYRKINEKWNLDYVRSEVGIFVKRNINKRKNRRDLSATFTSVSEFVITEKVSHPVQRFKADEISKPNDILVKQLADTDENFWGEENIILPDEPLLETILKLNKKPGPDIIPVAPVARTQEQ
ncbi:MAG: carboxypeptidase-like regulatory domain-containing protein [Bacteroidales bacterium]|nr:carboxypeptidase-like regulatory domain-containing protein [Bacteroidales bacterium]